MASESRLRTSQPDQRKTAFQWIFDSNMWGSAETRSGTGSSRVETRGVAQQLPALLDRLEVRTWLDVCGDMNWQLEVISQAQLLTHYIGIDIVEGAVAAARKRFESTTLNIQATASFRVCDVVSDSVPSADVILLRDVLAHLPLADGCRVIENLRQAGIRYLIATTFTGSENVDIEPGHWRALDMQAEPFGLGIPIELLDERCAAVPGKALGVWCLSNGTMS